MVDLEHTLTARGVCMGVLGGRPSADTAPMATTDLQVQQDFLFPQLEPAGWHHGGGTVSSFGVTPAPPTPRCHRIPSAMSCAVKSPNGLATDTTGASSCLTAAHPPLTRQVLKYPACAPASRDLASKLGERQGRDEGAPRGAKNRGSQRLLIFSPRDLNRR